MVSKWKRAIRKGHTNFLVFYFWYLKLVPIDSALNFASGKLTWISKKCTNGFKKDCQIWKSELIFSEMSFVIYSRKTGKYLNQNFLQEGDQELCGKNSVCQILILFLWLVTPPCFQVKVSQILQKVIVFFLEKEDEIKASFWHIWIVQWLKFFRTTAYVFRFFPSSGGKEEKRCPFGPKVLTLCPFLFHK